MRVSSFLSRLGAALAIVSLSQNAMATPEADRQAWLKRQFGGWGGINFYCRMNPDTEQNKQLCEWSREDISKVASAKGIKVNLENVDSFQKSKQGNGPEPASFLDVELELLSISTSSYALYIALRAAPYYLKAIKSNPGATSNDPRSGTLIIWQKTMIGSGETWTTDVAEGHRHFIQDMMSDLISDFSRGQQ